MRRCLGRLLPLLALAAATGASAQDHDAHVMSGMPTAETSLPASSPADGSPVVSAPQPPKDHAADAYYDPAAMAEARSMLRHESGAMSNSMVMVDRLEWRPGPQANRYDWEAEGWTGGDIDRLAFKTKGEGAFGGKAEKIELQAGWLHAIDPWFDVRAGIRQDLQPGPHRTQAVVAVEGLAPYWLDVEAELFLSQKGELTARTEASYDQRLTQSLILQPRAELNFSAQDVPELGLGSGLNSVELGLRLRYEITRRLGPYVGVSWERKLGGSARYARADDEKPQGARFVTGIRLWF